MTIPVLNHLEDWITEGEAATAADAAEVRAEVRTRQLAELMAEPAGPTRRFAAGRPRSGPVDTGGEFVPVSVRL